MRTILRVLWPWLRKRRKWLALAAVGMVGEVITSVLAPWPLKFIIDSVIFRPGASGTPVLQTHLDASSIRLLLILSAVAVAIAVVGAASSYIDDRATDIAALRAVYDLRRALFAHLQRLSMSFHEHRDTQVGDLLARLSGDVQALQDLAAVGFSNLVTNTLTLLAALGVMVFLDWRLAAVVAVFSVPMFFMAQRTAVSMRIALRAARRREGRVSAALQESLSAVKLVQSFGREDHESRRVAKESTKSLQASLKAVSLQARLGPLVTMLSGLAGVAVTLFGVVLVIQRSISPGELLIFIRYMRSMQAPVRQLAKLSFAIGKGSAGAARIEETFAKVPSVVEYRGAGELRSPSGHVVFDRVSFAYPDGRPILNDISLEARPGQVVALVGATGSGKSTLMSLLPRFYDPTSGGVLIDGRDIRSYTLASLRASLALVLQDSLIFRASLIENITYGRPDASPEEIAAAAEAAGVCAIAERLPEGYDTIVSERGGSLSGGEQQCIGIARALLKNAPIVVLDEPTSSMDSVTERLVMGGVERLLAGRTAFIIAHRLATVRNADLVAVLDSGRIVEMGTPDELMRRRGSIFATHARNQSMAS
ncbi:MAG TPA: ABC transporter ATP-binding protein [Candidatus Saccharimonadales bacterium]|nr:ABC transporter ATP-binding protein [Candidatus Saccharimonadales bacterium]